MTHAPAQLTQAGQGSQARVADLEEENAKQRLENEQQRLEIEQQRLEIEQQRLENERLQALLCYDGTR